MKKEEEEKVQGIGSGVVGKLDEEDATDAKSSNLKPFVWLCLFITRRVNASTDLTRLIQPLKPASRQ